MATYKTEGIILGRTNLGEADRILTILTKDLGMIRAVGKGLRKAKSKLAGHLELFTESELMLAKGKSLDVVTSARMVKIPPELSKDYDRLRQAYLFSEMISRISDEREHHPGLFELLDTALTSLGEGHGGEVLELWFKLQLLDKLGYHPGLEGCMICHTNDPARQYLFNFELGGIVDAGCRGATNTPMTQAQIKLWRLMIDHSLQSVQLIRGMTALTPEGLGICNHFYDYTFGKRFRSSEVLA